MSREPSEDHSPETPELMPPTQEDAEFTTPTKKSKVQNADELFDEETREGKYKSIKSFKAVATHLDPNRNSPPAERREKPEGSSKKKKIKKLEKAIDQLEDENTELRKELKKVKAQLVQAYESENPIATPAQGEYIMMSQNLIFSFLQGAEKLNQSYSGKLFGSVFRGWKKSAEILESNRVGLTKKTKEKLAKEKN